MSKKLSRQRKFSLKIIFLWAYPWFRFDLPAGYAGSATIAVLTPGGYGILGYEPLWDLVYGIAAVYILRRPGTGIVAEIIASVIEVI